VRRGPIDYIYAVIGRLLRGRGEPASIFEHVDARIRPDVPGLADDDPLPDEPDEPAELRFAPGAAERIFVSAPSDEDRAAVDRIYEALAALAAKPSQANRRRLLELFREGRVRQRIDLLRERLGEASPAKAVELYAELRELLLRSGHRDEVKYALALVSGFGRPEDADLFRVLARHEEFTLYAAIALASVVDDPVAEWLSLLDHVRGWGRTEVSELILRDPRSELVRAQLVRRGLGFENALLLAEGCRLDELLAAGEVDAELLDGACAIVAALVAPLGDEPGLADYAHAGPAIEALLKHLDPMQRGLGDALTVLDLRALLSDEARASKLAAAGFDDARRARVEARCDAFVERGSWAGRAAAALEAGDEDERVRARELISRLGPGDRP
jgi:hypothetical protein